MLAQPADDRSPIGSTLDLPEFRTHKYYEDKQ